ncbi:cytochrome P450 [Nannocystis radixulma]|uniref:Cytochrome P450 n=1 Tax=Nannocystis radixulma TaxID=2995305 RepID=A0ABT5B6Q2_9BACT|nr:cytochrome P450 [Nannocystis radixulma]MDC0669800.1 cytochrome P450 [Nannocystis radixulma]
MPALPPGPRSMLLTSFAVMREPIGAMTRARDKYGDPFTLPLAHGNLVLTADPRLAREVFAITDVDLFDTFGSTTLTPLFGQHSLLLMAGEPHRRERKLLLPPFHGERMRAFGATMADATRRALATVAPGQEFRALDLGLKVSLEVIIRAVYGVEERALVERHTAALVAMLDAALPIFNAAEVFQRAPFGLGPWAKFLRKSDEVDRLLYEQIDRVRERASERDDILSMMLNARYEDGSRMTDRDIRDELRTLLIAGHETTATTFAAALEELHRPENAHVRARLHDELAHASDAPEELARLPYLGAVIDETLRLHPVVEMVLRRLRRPWRLGDYELPAGTAVGVALPLVHQRADLYPDPTRFAPQRMLDRKPGASEFVPFGGGNRRCLGAALSLYELRIALAVTMREATLALREPKPVPIVRRRITLGPETGVRMQRVSGG